jgi:PAS domain-containing protein
LRRTSERLQVAARAAGIGIWDWDVVKGELLWDEAMYRLFGIRKEDFGGAYDAWAKSLAPEDFEWATAELLSRSVKTISTHRARILEKMGMRTNAELTHYVIQNKLIE